VGFFVLASCGLRDVKEHCKRQQHGKWPNQRLRGELGVVIVQQRLPSSDSVNGGGDLVAHCRDSKDGGTIAHTADLAQRTGEGGAVAHSRHRSGLL